MHYLTPSIRWFSFLLDIQLNFRKERNFFVFQRRYCKQKEKRERIHIPLSESSEQSMVSVLGGELGCCGSSFFEDLISGLSLLFRILRSVGSGEESNSSSTLQGKDPNDSDKFVTLSLTKDFDTNSVNPSIFLKF